MIGPRGASEPSRPGPARESCGRYFDDWMIVLLRTLWLDGPLGAVLPPEAASRSTSIWAVRSPAV